MNLAKKSHYNPCFWTALWNEKYFEAFFSGRERQLTAREQSVFSLNVRSGKVYKTKVKEVHFDKGINVAELTPEYMNAFARRWYPEKRKSLVSYLAANPETLYIDFEDVLRGVEQTGLYDCVLHAARAGGIRSSLHKAHITGALVVHASRSHEMLMTGLEAMERSGLGRFDAYWALKNTWSNPLALARAGQPLAGAKWVLYRTREHTFPLCDSPVMVEPKRLTVILSPRLLLQVHIGIGAKEDKWTTVDGISRGRVRQISRLTVANTYREIIFSDSSELSRWQKTRAFRERMEALSNSEGACSARRRRC